MNRTIRIGILTENNVMHDVFSYYRVVGPFAALRKFASKQGVNIELAHVLTIGWHTLRNLDILYMHRPYRSSDLEAIHMAKENGVKVWVDVDDNYFNLLPWFRHYATYMTPNVQMTMRNIYDQADVLTVSTQELARQLRAEVPLANIEVVPNGYPLNFARLPDKYEKFKTPFSAAITWRGTEESTKDLITFAQQTADFLNKNGLGLYSFGIYPWPLVEAGLSPDRIRADGLVAFEHFYNRMREIRPLFHLKVHEDWAFQRCRSHCAWMEAMHAGTTVVTPNFEEWERPNVIRFDQNNITGAMEQALKLGILERREQYEEAYNLIKTEYNQEDGALPQKRLKIIIDLLGNF